MEQMEIIKGGVRRKGIMPTSRYSVMPHTSTARGEKCILSVFLRQKTCSAWAVRLWSKVFISKVFLDTSGSRGPERMREFIRS